MTCSIIRAALGLTFDPQAHRGLLASRCAPTETSECLIHSIVIEAEMVAFNEDIGAIDEFFRIAPLVHRPITNQPPDRYVNMLSLYSDLPVRYFMYLQLSPRFLSDGRFVARHCGPLTRSLSASPTRFLRHCISQWTESAWT
jgi:hypothetical protein